MRVVYLRYLAILSMVGPGCRLAENAVRTTIVEPIQYSRNAYEKLTHKEFIELAQASLDQAISVRRAEMDNFACDPYSPDYCQGYIDGFVDYLEGGGNGEPPALPDAAGPLEFASALSSLWAISRALKKFWETNVDRD